MSMVEARGEVFDPFGWCPVVGERDAGFAAPERVVLRVGGADRGLRADRRAAADTG